MYRKENKIVKKLKMFVYKELTISSNNGTGVDICLLLIVPYNNT